MPCFFSLHIPPTVNKVVPGHSCRGRPTVCVPRRDRLLGGIVQITKSPRRGCVMLKLLVKLPVSIVQVKLGKEERWLVFPPKRVWWPERLIRTCGKANATAALAAKQTSTTTGSLNTIIGDKVREVAIFDGGRKNGGKKNKENVERHELYGVDGYAMSTTTLVFFSHGAGNWYLTMGTGCCCCRWRSSSWQFSPVGVARWKRTISPSSYPYKDGPALARPSLSLTVLCL